MIDPETLDKALTSLSEARTAIDDPAGLSSEQIAEVASFDRLNQLSEEAFREYTVSKIDDAMRLLGADDYPHS